MSDSNLKILAKLTKSGWKQLAKLEDPEDVEAVRQILIETLEALDKIEEQAQ